MESALTSSAWWMTSSRFVASGIHKVLSWLQTVVFVADPSLGGNILNFNVGTNLDLLVPSNFWSRLAGKFGTKFYWQDKGEGETIVTAVGSYLFATEDPISLSKFGTSCFGVISRSQNTNGQEGFMKALQEMNTPAYQTSLVRDSSREFCKNASTFWYRFIKMDKFLGLFCGLYKCPQPDWILSWSWVQVSAIDTCFREPPGKLQCSKIQGTFDEEPSSGGFGKFFFGSWQNQGCHVSFAVDTGWPFSHCPLAIRVHDCMLDKSSSGLPAIYQRGRIYLVLDPLTLEAASAWKCILFSTNYTGRESFEFITASSLWTWHNFQRHTYQMHAMCIQLVFPTGSHTIAAGHPHSLLLFLLEKKAKRKVGLLRRR